MRKLRDAGAVFLGKLNMHEFAYGGTSAVTHYGPVHNPWDLDYNPGGSSGGSAAAVAARLCAAALGTDTAASVRFPAACCGVAGLKATHGLASIRGIVPLSEFHDHVGPLARSVADCALVMTALAGFDPLDPVSIRAEREDYRAAIGTRRARAAHRHSALAVLRAARSRDRRGREARARGARRPHERPTRDVHDRGAGHLRAARRRDVRVSRAAARRCRRSVRSTAADAAAHHGRRRASRRRSTSSSAGA